MGSLSNYQEKELLDHIFGESAGEYTPPSTVYLGLSTADPGDDAGGLAEPSGMGYIRKAITFDAAASRLLNQTSTVTFDEATGSWGEITHYGIFDAESSGNMMAHGALSTSKGVVSGNTPSVAAGEVDISFSAGAISDYLANKLLDFAFRNQPFTQPTIYLALCTAAVTDSDDGDSITEPSGNNYARKAHAAWNAAADVSGQEGAEVDNNGDITFNTPSGSWGTVTYMAICDALTSGEVLFYGDVTDQEPGDGDTVKFPSGDLEVTVA